MDNMVFLIPAATILALAIIVKAILDNFGQLKRTAQELSDNNSKQNVKQQVGFNPISNLKWGFILAGLGLALLLKEYTLPNLSEGGTFGLMFLCAGLGFFIYFAIAKKATDKRETKKNGKK